MCFESNKTILSERASNSICPVYTLAALHASPFNSIPSHPYPVPICQPQHKGYWSKRKKTPANAIRQNGLFSKSKAHQGRNTLPLEDENSNAKRRKTKPYYSSSEVSVSVSLSDSTSPSVSLPSLDSSSAALRFLGACAPPLSVRIWPAIVSAKPMSVVKSCRYI